jgi:DNA polymerase I
VAGPSRPIVLSRRNDGTIDATDLEAATSQRLEAGELAEFVESRELDHPRWVWDDTNHWYPALLGQGIRVQHCVDLRLRHNILRNSPLIDQRLVVGDDIDQWDNFVEDTHELALFALNDHNTPLDVVAEYRRQQVALDACTESQRLQLLLNAESTSALVATEMTHVGLPWNVEVHQQILFNLLGSRPAMGMRPEKLEALANDIRNSLNSPALNPDSPAELLRALRSNGLTVSSTRSSELSRLVHPAVPALLEYRKLQRLHSANGWRWLETWVKAGRYRTTFVPGGVVSGRWAASGGGALSLPAQLRSAVVSDDGWVLVVADVAQLEPRVLAAMSSDEAMAKAAHGIDLYQNLVSSGVVATRDEAKLGMLGALYGATQGKSGAFVARLTQRYPKAFGLVESAARVGERGERVRTFLGRGSPLPQAEWINNLDYADVSSLDMNDRRSWGRFTRNFVVQGTGAEWAMCWMATLRNSLWSLQHAGTIKERPHLAFFLHDEIIVHTPVAMVDEVTDAVRDAAGKATRLLFGSFPIDFPLHTSAVRVYADAK